MGVCVLGGSLVPVRTCRVRVSLYCGFPRAYATGTAPTRGVPGPDECGAGRERDGRGTGLGDPGLV